MLSDPACCRPLGRDYERTHATKAAKVNLHLTHSRIKLSLSVRRVCQLSLRASATRLRTDNLKRRNSA